MAGGLTRKEADIGNTQRYLTPLEEENELEKGLSKAGPAQITPPTPDPLQPCPEMAADCGSGHRQGERGGGGGSVGDRAWSERE